MSTELPPRLHLAQLPTPFHPLRRISRELGGPTIWIKRDDLTGAVLSGNKVRKLEFVVAQAQEEGCDTLITCGGVQSNHCRATAFVGAQLGLQVELILRADGDDTRRHGNLLLDELAGAHLNIVSVAEYRRRLSELMQATAERLRSDGRKPFVIPTGASDEIGVWGYVTACEELKQDFATNNIAPRKLFVATGSGGTQAGLTVGSHLSELGVEVTGLAVCDSEAYFQNKVQTDLQAWQQRYGVQCDLQSLSINVNANYIGPGYAQATPEVFATIRRLAQTEGVVLDPVYSGKAFHGLITEVEQGSLNDENDIVFVHTGGLFGLFAQQEQLFPENKAT